MSRIIEFRGKIKYNGEHLFEGDWIYGSYIKKINGDFIHYIEEDEYGNIIRELDVEIISETLGEFIGIEDKNNKRIYEGDIIKDIDGIFKTGEIEYFDGSFELEIKDLNEYIQISNTSSYFHSNLEVIDNKHDKN